MGKDDREAPKKPAPLTPAQEEDEKLRLALSNIEGSKLPTAPGPLKSGSVALSEHVPVTSWEKAVLPHECMDPPIDITDGVGKRFLGNLEYDSTIHDSRQKPSRRNRSRSRKRARSRRGRKCAHSRSRHRDRRRRCSSSRSRSDTRYSQMKGWHIVEMSCTEE